MKYLIFLCFLALFSCTNHDKAKSVLSGDGYENIEITGYDWFACSRDDFYSTGFVATKNGKRVSGVVCSGLLFKGSTIRFY